jgi:hypothetical protein
MAGRPAVREQWFKFRALVILFCGYNKRVKTPVCAVIRLSAVRNLNLCSDHTVSLLFVVFLFVHVEQSVVMCVCLCACDSKVLWCACVCVRATAMSSKCLWYSVVPFCQQLQHTGGTSSRRQTQDQSERSNAQTVTLQPKSVGWTFSGWGPIRRRMGWVLVANQVRHSTDTSLSWCQSGPRLAMITTSRARQLCIWCGNRHDSGPRNRSSWQPCECEFFYLVFKFCPPCPPRYVPQLGSVDSVGRVK